jgi:glycine hydroxymethyltransferase
MTTRGWKEADFIQLAEYIDLILSKKINPEVETKIKSWIKMIANKYPLYPNLK